MKQDVGRNDQLDGPVALQQKEALPTVMSQSAQVRKHLSAKEAANNNAAVLRQEDPETGELMIFSSVETLMSWLPKLDYDQYSAWSKLPIFRVRLFSNRDAYDRGISYADQTFPAGEDLAYAFAWWRKRISQASRGFAAFEGGFDTTGPIYLTDPPVFCVCGETGEVTADGPEVIERKREIHNKRKKMDLKWSSKGLSDEARVKIESAELLIRDKKARGQEYMLKGGWVAKKNIFVGAGVAMTVARHNELQKRCECR